MDLPGGGVGFFDSGIGGLTVLKSCLNVCGGLPVYYYGDNKRAPYGNLPPETIREYAREAFGLFGKLRVIAAVIACNTVTAVCADEFRKSFPFPVIGAEPAVFPAAKKGGRIFILATRERLRAKISRLCLRAMEKYPQAELCAYACDGLAGAVEKHLFSGEGYDFASFFPKGKPDAVVLGCTHYIFLKEKAEIFYGCPVYDGNEGISRRLADILALETEKAYPLALEAEKIDSLWPPVTTDSDFLCLPTTFAPFCPLKRAVSRKGKKHKSEHLFARLFEKSGKLPRKKGFFSRFFPRKRKNHR
ncbi:MAG: glutamate racemase [Christensenellaceae bacterium]